MRLVALPLLATCLALLAACDATREGREAWQAGRYEDAFDAFEREVEADGEDASAELLYDHALAALQTGRLDVAEGSARAALERGQGGVIADATFLRGNVAFARSRAAEAEAGRAGGDPTAGERAVADTEDALAAWRAAAMLRKDWPEARRNVERALLRLRRLRESRRTGPGGPPPVTPPRGPLPPEGPSPTDRPPLPPPPQPAPDSDSPPGPTPDLATEELTPARVMQLLGVLEAKERERMEARRTVRRRASASVEKDW